MRAPLDTTTSDTVLAFLLCALLLAAVAIAWDHARAPRCDQCDQRLHPRTIPELDAAEQRGLCLDCHHRTERLKANLIAHACATRGCTKTWNGTEWVCGVCGLPLALDQPTQGAS